jgi:pyrroloquinoline quinone (PQQ) biosynthesis protein C
MEIRQRLEGAIGGHRLLDHPFYVAWREGTLPVESLATYAAEYGAFIAAVPEGWATVGNAQHSAEEVEHARIWETFAGRLGTFVGEPRIAEVATLVDTARRLFADRATAWGALYAFEAQQPGTSEEKLKGLVEHYGFGAADAASEYFRIHAADYNEADEIVTALGEDPSVDDHAVEACGEMSAALWEALSGVLAAQS